MELNGAVTRNGGEILRYELQQIAQDGDIDTQGAQRLARLLDPQGGQRKHGNGSLLSGHPERVGCLAGLLRSAKDPSDGVATFDERIQGCFAKVLLTHNSNAHESS